MATLADELLNDFDDTGSEADAEKQDDSVATPATGPVEESDGDEDTKTKVEKLQLSQVGDVRTVAGLMMKLEPVLEQVALYQNAPSEKGDKLDNFIENNPEYQLLTQSNTLSTSIDDEIILVHKFIRDHYSTRFPELETLVTNPLDYAKTVAIIGNGPMDSVKDLAQKADSVVKTPLRSILDGPTLMVITVEATTTRGQPMSESELLAVNRACEMVLSLDRAKSTLSSYVQSRMTVFAPNLTALVGSLTAAQILNFTGGLTKLASTPACNIPSFGSNNNRAKTGFATNTGVRHQGFLYQSSLISNIPSDLKKQAMRIVSAKIILAARVDCNHESPDGATGQDFKQACLARLDKLTEPPPNKGPRALPAPDDKPARKRGGRRARIAKAQTAMTDLRKAQNRMAFGKEEKEVGYGTGEGTKGLGMIGQANDGRIRAQKVDQRTKARLSKNNKGWGAADSLGGTGAAASLRSFGQAGSSTSLGLRKSGVGQASGGTMSTIAFTPVQGLELVDPHVKNELKRKREEEQDRWFKSGTFTQIGGAQTAATPGETAKQNGEFKVPALPVKKAAV
ncbi:MAG: hypothetical protein LQ342_002295 [Letrouitia transgressa]|nr:MAG: hypothetical protein LQ342_002295 [Letrouitia transgressa]